MNKQPKTDGGTKGNGATLGNYMLEQKADMLFYSKAHGTHSYLFHTLTLSFYGVDGLPIRGHAARVGCATI